MNLLILRIRSTASSLDRKRDVAVILLDVALQDVGAGAENALESVKKRIVLLKFSLWRKWRVRGLTLSEGGNTRESIRDKDHHSKM